jgi:DNA-binding NarL/FixJ family response regulator
VYVVSATETQSAYETAKQLGAQGYLPKSLPMEDLSGALVTALDKGTWFPKQTEETSGDNMAERVASLTPAQQKVMSSLAEGLLNKQIAYEMGISVATVKAHMTAIFRKLGVFNRTQALLVYNEAMTIN